MRIIFLLLTVILCYSPLSAQENSEVLLAEAWKNIHHRYQAIRNAAFDQILALKEAAVPSILERVSSPYFQDRFVSLKLLALISPETALPYLVSALNDQQLEIVHLARDLILEVYHPGNVKELQRCALFESLGGLRKIPHLDRLVYLYQLRAILDYYSRWRTKYHKDGIYFYGMFQHFPQQYDINVIFRFLVDAKITAKELGPHDWRSAATISLRILKWTHTGKEIPTIRRFLGIRRNAETADPMLIITGSPTNRVNGAYELESLATLVYQKKAPRSDVARALTEPLIRRASLSGTTTALIAFAHLEVGNEEIALMLLQDYLEQSKQSNQLFGFYDYRLIARITIAALKAKQLVKIIEKDERLKKEAEIIADLKQACELGWQDARWLRIDPRFNTIRQNQQFEDLVVMLERVFGKD